MEGIARFHELVARPADEPAEVVIGIETDRGLFAGALMAAGYQVFAVNPMPVSRYRDRHAVSGAKSDPGDAKVLARAHQSMIWSRRRHANMLRSALREFYPAALAASDDLTSGDAVEVLRAAPAPALGAALSRPKIAAALRRGGRQPPHRCAGRADPGRAACPPAPAGRGDRGGDGRLGQRVGGGDRRDDPPDRCPRGGSWRRIFEAHPDAEVVRSLPGLGTVLGARVLGEFGDALDRYATAKSRRNYAGTSPITRASGTHRVVLARHARNKRLADAIYLWAFSALGASPGARSFYDHRRAAGDTHHQALRALGNRLVGILHGCLASHTPYSETTAWARRTSQPATRAA